MSDFTVLVFAAIFIGVLGWCVSIPIRDHARYKAGREADAMFWSEVRAKEEDPNRYSGLIFRAPSHD